MLIEKDSISGQWNSVGTTIMFSCCIYFSLLFTLYCCLLFCYLFVVFPFFDISCLFINLSPKQLYVSWRVTVILRAWGGKRQSFYAVCVLFFSTEIYKLRNELSVK